MAVSALAVSACAAASSAFASGFSSAFSSAFSAFAAATAGDLPAFTSGTCDGGRHISSLHAPYSK